ncbi:ferritin-like domain-containing protein [Herbidospora mongoliensis]|uniref:ferritin-like domain-containing protein n=1 Tax=Herbidospora mongoliensis TaxID=688067 RepID=UPI000832BC44|nr:ferritin-like domain-containing protein [Herbidospora mongoliensis]
MTALSKALAAEHAAVYAYGVIGAKTSGALRVRATTGFDAHRARRDQLRNLMRRRGETPAEPGNYQLPFVVTTAAQAVRLAAYVEERVCAAYVELSADTDPALRRLAVLATQESAVRGFGWQPEIVAFPGMPGQVKTVASPAVSEPMPMPPASGDPAAPRDSVSSSPVPSTLPAPADS